MKIKLHWLSKDQLAFNEKSVCKIVITNEDNESVHLWVYEHNDNRIHISNVRKGE